MDDLRNELKKNLGEKKEKRKITSLAEKIKDFKQKHKMNFAVDREVSYDYLIKLREVLCKEILDELTANGMKDKQALKPLFFALLKCMVYEEAGNTSKNSSIKIGKALMAHVLKHAEDNVKFFCEVLDEYVLGSGAQRVEKADQALISQFLQANAPHDLTSLFIHFEDSFDCPY